MLTVDTERRRCTGHGRLPSRLTPLALALFAAGCGAAASPSAPSPTAAPATVVPALPPAPPLFSATGTWRGTVVYDVGSEIGRQVVSAQLNQEDARLTGTVVLAGITGRIEGTVAGQTPSLSFLGTIQLEGSATDPRVHCVSMPTPIAGRLAPSIAWQSETVTFVNCPGALRIHLELSQG